MTKQKQIILKGGQPVTVNFKWKAISLSEVDLKIESIFDTTTGKPLTDYFTQAEQQEIIKQALADFYNN